MSRLASSSRLACRLRMPTCCCSSLLLLGGCAGYQIGNQSLYPQEIRTVYVPMFQSISFRRNLGERLTEAVVKEIEKQHAVQSRRRPERRQRAHRPHRGRVETRPGSRPHRRRPRKPGRP